MKNSKKSFDRKRLLLLLADAVVLFIAVVISYLLWAFLTGRQDVVIRKEVPLYLFGFIGCGVVGMW